MQGNSLRAAAFSGSFYPSSKIELSNFITKALDEAKIEDMNKNILSVVSPHAGYIYSGGTAAFSFKALKNQKPAETFVMIGPNHTGRGDPISISQSDWKTPLGTVKNDTEFSNALASYSNYLSFNDEAHEEEHSIEVQLPFLQSIVKDPKCVFVCMGDQSYEACGVLNNAINTTAKKLGRKITVIASSDMNHYESAKIAEAKDQPALDVLAKMDPMLFHEMIEKSGDSACGYGPITTACMYAKENGAKQGRLLQYSNSGRATRDYDSVVAYASVIFTK